MGILILMAIAIFMEWRYMQNNDDGDGGLFHPLQLHKLPPYAPVVDMTDYSHIS